MYKRYVTDRKDVCIDYRISIGKPTFVQLIHKDGKQHPMLVMLAHSCIYHLHRRAKIITKMS